MVHGTRDKAVLTGFARTTNHKNHQRHRTNQKHYADFQRNQLFIDQLTHFLQCIERRETPSIPLADGASSLATALAIKKSLVTGQAVALP